MLFNISVENLFLEWKQKFIPINFQPSGEQSYSAFDKE